MVVDGRLWGLGGMDCNCGWSGCGCVTSGELDRLDARRDVDPFTSLFCVDVLMRELGRDNENEGERDPDRDWLDWGEELRNNEPDGDEEKDSESRRNHFFEEE